MRLAWCSAAMALLIVATSGVSACPVDVTTSLPATDLKISATGDAFVQYLGSAKALIVTDDHAGSSNESESVTLSPASGHAAPVAALIPLPPAMWTGMVGLAALAAQSIAGKLRRR